MNIQSGSLRDFSLPDIFQIMSMEDRSGLLAIRSLRWEGHVRFAAGQVVDAAFGDWRDEEAVYLMFTFAEGRFHFEQEAGEDQPPSLAFPSTADLIAEGLRRSEAWQKLQEQHPRLLLTSWVEPTEPAGISGEAGAAASPDLDPDAARILAYLRDRGTCAHGVMVADVIHGLKLTERRAGHLLAELAEQGALRLVDPQEQGVQHLFNTVTHTLFTKFAAISGWRMVEGFVEQMRQVLASTTDPPVGLRHEHQSLVIEWLSPDLSPEQAAVLRQLLMSQIDTVGRAHGANFVQRLLGDIYEAQSADQQRFWQDLDLPLPQPSSVEPVS